MKIFNFFKKKIKVKLEQGYLKDLEGTRIGCIRIEKDKCIKGCYFFWIGENKCVYCDNTCLGKLDEFLI